MPRHLAFLRAINVGGHTVKMSDLRALFEALGFRYVETFIASGNVLFDAPSRNTGALEARIERQLKDVLGYAVATFLRTPAELAAIAAYRPFRAADPVPAGEALMVGFLKAPPSADVERRLLALRTDTDDFHVHGRELYWRARAGVGKSSVGGALLEKTLGAPATFRNVTTVRRLASKVGSAPAEAAE
jgi:uncharacterized protein (DUF1697 family)